MQGGRSAPGLSRGYIHHRGITWHLCVLLYVTNHQQQLVCLDLRLVCLFVGGSIVRGIYVYPHRPLVPSTLVPNSPTRLEILTQSHSSMKDGHTRFFVYPSPSRPPDGSLGVPLRQLVLNPLESSDPEVSMALARRKECRDAIG